MHVRVPVIGAVAVLLVTAGIVRAQEPAVGDIALCNEEATRKTGGSAFPGPRPGPDVARESRHATGVNEPRSPLTLGPSAVLPGGRRGERTDPSGSIITESPDPLLKGLDAERADDEGYRTAYRDCMRQRARSTR
jgi:hypothetical protein